jgi:5-methyltetrahydrofolate--homocysteine methyltransferase
MSDRLIQALATMKEQEALSIVEELLEQGTDPLDILRDCKEAMTIVGDNFASGKYFLPELVMAGEMLLRISQLIKPRLEEAIVGEEVGRVLIGTVAGDLHDIGKDIVALMLEVNGFNVMNLGIDIPPSKFVESIREFRPQVVGLSGFLTLAFDSMKETVEAISAAGLRDQVKIMIGGGQIDAAVLRHTGADDYGMDAMDAVAMAKRWVGGGQS